MKENKLKKADKIILLVIDTIYIVNTIILFGGVFFTRGGVALGYMLFFAAVTGGVWVLYLAHMLWLKLRYNINPFATSIQFVSHCIIGLITLGYIALWMI